MQFIILMGLMFVMMYFVLIRPQQKKAKQHEELLKTLKPGDKVVTSSGICGVIISIKERTVSLRSADSKLEILKSAVTQVLEKSGNKSK
ncbi:MAG: preprotein translocase subunit YajC [Verrucomicrobia bacterium]|nr:preprotein translocase subunit YajC [Verrucomicrobiota bacterium]